MPVEGPEAETQPGGLVRIGLCAVDAASGQVRNGMPLEVVGVQRMRQISGYTCLVLLALGPQIDQLKCWGIMSEDWGIHPHLGLALLK
jgi:hypothetical protein